MTSADSVHQRQNTTVTGVEQSDPAARAPESVDSPIDLPAHSWKDAIAAAVHEVRADRVPMLSSAVAFWSFLAFVPALFVTVSIYGLLANPQQIDRQMNSWLGSAPREVRQLLTAQLQSITRHAGAATGIGIAVGVLVALWSASSGVAHLIEATNVAYDEEETRGFVHRRLLALALTLGAALFIAVAVGLIAVLPSALARTGLGVSTRVLLGVARWVVLLVGMTLALAVLYRVAPDRPEPKWWWISPGALLATLIWLAASALFAVYTANFGKYNETYGALGAIVVLMLWLYITAFAILVGAELNAELEARATEG